MENKINAIPETIRNIIFIVIFTAVIFSIGFFVGDRRRSARNRAEIVKLTEQFDRATERSREIAETNNRLTKELDSLRDENRELRKNLESAENLIDGIGSGIQNDIVTISDVIDRIRTIREKIKNYQKDNNSLSSNNN